MPNLNVIVESTIRKYLTGELTDEGFKESIQAILNEFEGKNLLHQNIGQRALEKKRYSEEKTERVSLPDGRVRQTEKRGVLS